MKTKCIGMSFVPVAHKVKKEGTTIGHIQIVFSPCNVEMNFINWKIKLSSHNFIKKMLKFEYTGCDEYHQIIGRTDDINYIF